MYPIFLKTEQLQFLIDGGGKVALEKLVFFGSETQIALFTASHFWVFVPIFIVSSADVPNFILRISCTNVVSFWFICWLVILSVARKIDLFHQELVTPPPQTQAYQRHCAQSPL